MNFAFAVVFHVSLALPLALTKPEEKLLAEPCTVCRFPTSVQAIEIISFFTQAWIGLDTTSIFYHGHEQSLRQASHVSGIHSYLQVNQLCHNN